MDTTPYNPLAKENLGAGMADAMLSRPPHPLGGLEPFHGAGIYAIYYTGGFSAYGPLVERNRRSEFEVPVYVGKGVAPGTRKGVLNADPGQVLYARLVEHADDVKSVKNLKLCDFFCRFLVVDDIWIALGESLLIARLAPVWNKLVDGFGNHDPGKGRHSGARPKWDTLHPGRAWAEKCRKRKETQKQIAEEVRAYLTTNMPQ